MLVYLRDGSAQTVVRAATLRQKLQIKLSILPSHSILTSGRPVPALTGAWQGSQFLSHWYDSTLRRRDSNPGSSAPEADALTTRPTRRWLGRARLYYQIPRSGDPTAKTLLPLAKLLACGFDSSQGNSLIWDASTASFMLHRSCVRRP